MKILLILLIATNIFAQKNLLNTEYVIPTINYTQSFDNNYLGAGLYGNVVNGKLCAFVDYKYDFKQTHMASVGITKTVTENFYVYMGYTRDFTKTINYDATMGFIYKLKNTYINVGGDTATKGLTVGIGVGLEIFSQIKEKKVPRTIDYSRYTKMN